MFPFPMSKILINQYYQNCKYPQHQPTAVIYFFKALPYHTNVLFGIVGLCLKVNEILSLVLIYFWFFY